MSLDGYTIDQFFRQQTPDTGKEPDPKTLAETAGKLLERTGPAIMSSPKAKFRMIFPAARYTSQPWIRRPFLLLNLKS